MWLIGWVLQCSSRLEMAEKIEAMNYSGGTALYIYRAFAGLHMMSQHSNSLATATAAILVHNENILRLCTKMAAVSMAKGCMQTLYS